MLKFGRGHARETEAAITRELARGIEHRDARQFHRGAFAWRHTAPEQAMPAPGRAGGEACHQPAIAVDQVAVDQLREAPADGRSRCVGAEYSRMDAAFMAACEKLSLRREAKP